MDDETSPSFVVLQSSSMIYDRLKEDYGVCTLSLSDIIYIILFILKPLIHH